jgi:hypothetical protein
MLYLDERVDVHMIQCLTIHTITSDCHASAKALPNRHCWSKHARHFTSACNNAPLPSALRTVQERLEPERRPRLVLEHVVDICCVLLKHLVGPASNNVLQRASHKQQQ